VCHSEALLVNPEDRKSIKPGAGIQCHYLPRAQRAELQVSCIEWAAEKETESRYQDLLLRCHYYLVINPTADTDFSFFLFLFFVLWL
jgi:hypothetical protein